MTHLVGEHSTQPGDEMLVAQKAVEAHWVCVELGFERFDGER